MPARSASESPEPPSAAGSAPVPHPASSRQERAAAWCPRAPAGGDRGWVAGRSRAGTRPGAASCARPPRAGPHLRPRHPCSSRELAPHSAAHSRLQRTISDPRRRGGGKGRGGGLICRCRSFLPPPTAGGAAGLGDARQTRLITASPSSAPRLPPGSPAHSAPSAAPSAGFLRTSSSFWGSGSPLLSGSWERAGCWDASKERGNRERDNCVLQGPCLQCIFIPGHGLALQVFAPLGSMDRRQALPGAHKETNRAHVSNPYAAGDAKRSGEAACRLHPSQQAARARVNGFMHAFRLTTTESGSWLSIFWGKMGTVAVTRGCK